MTPKERVFAALNHQETDLVPYNLSLSEVAQDRLRALRGEHALDTIVNHFAVAAVDVMHKDRVEGETFEDPFGSVWRQGNIFHLVGAPLSQPALAGYEFPDLMRPDLWEGVRSACEQHRDRFLACGIGLAFFERAWGLRGMEALLIDFVAHPRFVDDLLDRLMALHFPVIDRVAELGADAMYFGDDFGQQRGLIMGPRHFRRYLKPRLEQMYAYAKGKGLRVAIHSCGDVSEIVGDLIEMGVDIINPFQPEAMDVFALKREYGKHVTFNGGIGTQHLLPQGTPEEIRAAVRDCITQLGAGGGYIMETAKPVMEDVPAENVAALLDAMTLNREVLRMPRTQP